MGPFLGRAEPRAAVFLAEPGGVDGCQEIGSRKQCIEIGCIQLRGHQLAHVPMDLPTGALLQSRQVQIISHRVGGCVGGGAGKAVLIVPEEGLRHMIYPARNVHIVGDIGGVPELVQFDGQILVRVFHQLPVDHQGEAQQIHVLNQRNAAVVAAGIIVDRAGQP